MTVFTKEDLWETSHCPSPNYCSLMEFEDSATCESLSSITDPAILSEHLSQSSTKNQFHASANPHLAAEDRARLLLIAGELLAVHGASNNPSICRNDFPALEDWDFPHVIGFGKRTDIITEEDMEYFFTTTTTYTLWLALMDGQLTPKIEQLLLDKPDKLLPMKEAWARRGRASSDYVAACLNMEVGQGVHKDDIEELWFTAAKHHNLPLPAIFTAPLRDDFTEGALVENAEKRSEEAKVWIGENYPELAGVPFSWVRSVLAVHPEQSRA